MKDFVFRAVDPRNDDDMHKYFNLAESLSCFLKNNASFDEDQLRWAKIRMGARDDEQVAKEKEFVFVCELDGEFVGYVDICNYHVKDDKIVYDKIGAIHEIYIKPEFQKISVAFKLLKIAVEKLIEEGKTKAVMEVQEDNENRFLHFALAKGNIIETSVCKRTDGTETMSYILLVDLFDLQKLSLSGLAVRTAHIKKKMLQETSNEYFMP